MGRIGGGRGLIMLERTDHWQLGYVLPKGRYQELHAAGLEPFKRSIASMVPWLGARVDELREWKQCSLLAVESDRLPRWYRPGLLLIGDSAHVMSPVGGNGINYAVQDAAAAANRLSGPLQSGHLSIRDLAAVQHRREWPTRLTQAIVTQIQDRVIGRIIRENGGTAPPVPPLASFLLRIPLLQRIPLAWVAYGIWPMHLDRRVRAPAAHLARPTLPSPGAPPH
jgi:2-polyprenyl-6-methoxyphenol hydroxylase-like FAD-dependent oxidoreductase